MAGIFPDMLPLPSAPAGKQWQENSSSIGDAAGGFPTGQRSCLPPKEALSHLAPDFNTLPRELSRPFPSLGLKEGKVFFLPPQQLTQSCSETGKQRFSFFVQAQSKKKGQILFWAVQLGMPGRCPGRVHFKPNRLIYPENLNSPLH